MTAAVRREPSRGDDHLIAAAVFAVLTIIFFFPVIFQGRWYTAAPGTESVVPPWSVHPAASTFPVQADEAVLSAPWNAAETDALTKGGTLPLWGREFGGYPLFANGASGELYPPRLFLDATGMSAAAVHDVMSILDVFLAGLFAYALARALRLGFLAGVFAGAAWMLSGFNLAWLQFEVLAPAMVLLPLDLWLVRRACDRPTAGSRVAAGLAIGVTLVSGQILFMVLTAFVAGAYSLVLACVEAWRRRSGRPLLGPAIAGAVALGSAAVVLLPTAADLSGGNRSPLTWAEVGQRWSLTGEPMTTSATSLVHLLVPPSVPLSVPALNDSVVFAGALVTMLAVLGLFVRRPGAGLGRTLAIGVVAMSAGGPATWLAFRVFPLMRYFRPYGRALGLVAFGVVLLAACAVEELVAILPPSEGPWFRSAATLVVGGLVVVTSIQLIEFGREVNPPFAPHKAPGMQATPVINALAASQRSEAWPARALPIASSAQPFAPICCDLQDLFPVNLVEGYDSSVPTRTVALLRVLEGAPVAEATAPLQAPYVNDNLSTLVRYDVLGRLGINELVTAPSASVFGRTVYAGPDGSVVRLDQPAALRVAGNVRAVSDASAALRQFTDPGFAWQGTVVLERSQLARSAVARSLPAADSAAATAATVEGTGGVNTERVTVRSPSAGLLVIPVNWDGGWSARVNGHRTPVLRGNYDQQVVPVPAGASVVSLRYRPVGFGLGLLITVLTLVVAALYVGLARVL